jgi:hypothetical protein
MNALREFAVSLFARPMLNLFTWDELARRSLWDWYGFGPEHVAGVATEPDAFEQLAALSAHPNGHVRERVVVALATHGSRALPWLLLRTVDWVLVVRSVARTAVRALLVDAFIDAFVDALPIALRTREFSRAGASVMNEIAPFLARQPDLIWQGALAHTDAAVRRAAITLLAETGRATPNLLRIALTDRDLTVRVRAGRLVTVAPEMASLRAMLLDDRDPSLCLHALRLALEVDPAPHRARLERALTHRVRAMRELARHHLGGTFAEFYRARLLEPSPAPAVIQGLAETGSADDWEHLVPALDMSSKRACAGLVAMASLNRKASRETRLMMVDDPRRRVSQVAAHTMLRDVWESDAPILSAYLTSPHLHVRVSAVQLACCLPGWAPPLLLLSVDDPALAPTVLLHLTRWLSKHHRQIRPPTAVERARLQVLLQRPEVRLQELLGFLEMFR